MKLMMRYDATCAVPCIKVYETSLISRKSLAFMGINRSQFDFDLVCFGSIRPPAFGSWKPEYCIDTFRCLSLSPLLYYWSIDYPEYFRPYDPAKDDITVYFSIFKDIVNGSKDCHLP